jgi:hypothetical protein
MDYIGSPFMVKVYLLLGAFYVFRTIYRIISTVLYYMTRSMGDHFKTYGVPASEGFDGSYALVTGASDGIGLAYCKHLSSLGFNILMVSRNESKL